MIVRGNPDDVQANREGHLTPQQQARLGRLTPFRMPALPGALFGALLIIYGLTRQDLAGWIMVGLGALLLGSSWSRYRSRAVLKAGAVESVVGVLERTRSVPLQMFEAEVAIGGRSYVLLANLGQRPLATGSQYRAFVVRGLSRFGVIIAMEEA